MSKHLTFPLTLGLALAMAHPLGAIGVPRPVVSGFAKEAAAPREVRVQTPKARTSHRNSAKHGVQHPAARAKAPRSPQRPVNLNTATVTELMQLPRIGMGTAERIVAFRKEHGAFKRPEEVMNVKGIGEKSFAKLKPFLLVSAPAR